MCTLVTYNVAIFYYSDSILVMIIAVFGYRTQLFAYLRSPHALVYMMPTNNAGFLVPVLANAALARHSTINTYDFVDQYQLRFSTCEAT